MKFYFTVIFAAFLWMQSHAQNILEALNLKESKISQYSQGELMATDTIVDLRNGYYEEFLLSSENTKTILRHATIFNNKDGSKVLAISVCYWDFVCFKYNTSFYRIKGTEITEMLNNDLIPPLSFSEFFINSEIMKIANNYLPQLQGNYLEADANVDQLFNELYDIAYVLPRKGTTILAQLKICDYIPTNEIKIASEDWIKLSNELKFVELKFDKKTIKFSK